MSVWQRYPKEERQRYIQFLQIYGALSNLFRQKKGDLIPYLDSKFQETVFDKIFSNSENKDIGNTPHDILSVFGDERIGVGLKTWVNSKPSFQKVMQLKRFQNEINTIKNSEELAYKISEIKNQRMIQDYARLGLSEDKNVYHYITRDKGSFTINECAYPLVDLNNLRDFQLEKSSISWSDGKKEYKYTFADSQILQKFDIAEQETFEIQIIQDPFEFLLNAYQEFISPLVCVEEEQEEIEVYLPLYSYETKEVAEKSGLNAWNGAPKNPDKPKPRPLNEIYIPIPKEFHKKHPDFFVPDITPYLPKDNKLPKPRFHLQLPNGKRIPALITQDNMKGLQSGSLTERDENGKKYGQSALGQWLLIDVLGLKERQLVTREWLQQKGTDCVRLWRKKDDYSLIHIDFAPIGAFKKFMDDEEIEK